MPSLRRVKIPRKFRLPVKPLPLPPPKKDPPYTFIFLTLIALSLWFVWDSLNPPLPKANEPPTLYSNQSKQDLVLTFLEALHLAKKSIYLVMFGLTDTAILNTLIQKSKAQVETTIYYDPKASPNLLQLFPYNTIHAVAGPGLMHQKILVLDDEMVFIGSANMTLSSLKMHDNLVIGLASKPIAAFLKEKAPYETGHIETFVGGQKVSLWLLPDPKGHALDDLKHKIRNATRSIRIALFTFTHPTLLDELILAHKRGVDVAIVLDAQSASGASSKTAAILKAAKIPTFINQGIQLLHHKFVYIDEQTLITGSANWTKAAFTKNHDCLIELQQLTDTQKEFLNTLWNRIQTRAKSI
jgi:phosphatidylserine/phosphatidylglycerophosphate/cardiolipin synthase-like enzyme